MLGRRQNRALKKNELVKDTAYVILVERVVGHTIRRSIFINYLHLFVCEYRCAFDFCLCRDVFSIGNKASKRIMFVYASGA